jgi:antitoxin component YwqK of YwqJK toxin-antitoxin module
MANRHIARKRLLAGLALAAAVGIAVFLTSRPEAPTETVRVPRSSVELKDGRLCPKAGGGPFTGVMFDESEGHLLAEIPVKDGQVHGLARGWHDNGQLEVEEPFEEGSSHGLRTRWHPNGQKRSEANIVRGVLEGTFTQWHDNGQLAVRMTMKGGKAEGLSETWNPDGSLRSSVTLHDGQPVDAEMAISP